MGGGLFSRLSNRVGNNVVEGGERGEGRQMLQKGRSHRRRRQGRRKEGGGHIVVVEPRRHDVGKRWGRGDNDDSCGTRGCVVIVIVVVERCGKKRPRGEVAGGRR
jgi:hypothetical protein